MDETIRFLEKNDIRFDHIIFDLPYGERILINDIKKSGMLTAYAINKERDGAMNLQIERTEDL